MSEWDEHAGAWDDRPGVRAYADAAHASLVRHAAAVGFELDGLVVCDFGCGTGLLTERLAERSAHIDAVDTSTAMLDVLRDKVARHGWTHVTPRVDLPDVPRGYDLVVCSSVLAFVEDHPAVVAALAGHLRPGGWFVQWDWERDPGDGDGSVGFSPSDVRAALVGAGLQQTEVRHAFELVVDGHVMRPLMGTGRRAV